MKDEVSSALEENMEYLAQLLAEKKQFEVQSHGSPPPAIARLVDGEIERVRSAIFESDFDDEDLKLPEAKGEMVQLSEKVFIPQKEFPDYNFVGRILGPRGMTAKQLEKLTGCKIMVRGKNSLRDDSKESVFRHRTSYEHLKEELHVLIQCQDTEERAKVKLAAATRQVEKLLVPPPTKGIDDLKRKQLTELSILNGTYRSTSTSGASRQSTPVAMQFPSTPAFLYSPVNPTAYVPPHRRASQQQMHASSSAPPPGFMHTPPPPAAFYQPHPMMECQEFVDPGIEEVARALEELNFHQMMSYNAHSPLQMHTPRFVSVTAPATPCRPAVLPILQTPQKPSASRRVVSSVKKHIESNINK